MPFNYKLDLRLVLPDPASFLIDRVIQYPFPAVIRRDRLVEQAIDQTFAAGQGIVLVDQPATANDDIDVDWPLGLRPACSEPAEVRGVPELFFDLCQLRPVAALVG